MLSSRFNFAAMPLSVFGWLRREGERRQGGRLAGETGQLSQLQGIVRERMGVYEGKMARKGEFKAESHVWAWAWHSLRWPSQEGGDVSPDNHCSLFNSTPPPIRF